MRALGEEERTAVERVLRRRTLYRGVGLVAPEEVERCEEELARLVGRRHVVLMNSGTSALLAALHALGIGEGDEVIVPGFGWLTNLSTVLYAGATPVLVPTGPGLGLDPSWLEEARSARTRAITPVHACGSPCLMEPILSFARRHGLSVLDDASQAMGTSAAGGDLTAFSFQAFKIVTSGEGGALGTDDEALYRAAVRFHDAGLERMAQPRRGAPGLELPRGLGLNLRMSELDAALLRVQLTRLPALKAALGRAAEALTAALAPAMVSGAVRRVPPAPGQTENQTFLVLEAAEAGVARAFEAALNEAGCRVLLASRDRYHGIQGWLEYLEENRLPYRVVGAEDAKRVQERVLMLHVNWEISEAELEQVRAGVAAFLRAS
jgi:dTDP-4-amino-4,6-dideoxygalactose transaminase